MNVADIARLVIFGIVGFGSLLIVLLVASFVMLSQQKHPVVYMYLGTALLAQATAFLPLIAAAVAKDDIGSASVDDGDYSDATVARLCKASSVLQLALWTIVPSFAAAMPGTIYAIIRSVKRLVDEGRFAIQTDHALVRGFSDSSSLESFSEKSAKTTSRLNFVASRTRGAPIIIGRAVSLLGLPEKTVLEWILLVSPFLVSIPPVVVGIMGLDDHSEYGILRLVNAPACHSISQTSSLIQTITVLVMQVIGLSFATASLIEMYRMGASMPRNDRTLIGKLVAYEIVIVASTASAATVTFFRLNSIGSSVLQIFTALVPTLWVLFLMQYDFTNVLSRLLERTGSKLGLFFGRVSNKKLTFVYNRPLSPRRPAFDVQHTSEGSRPRQQNPYNNDPRLQDFNQGNYIYSWRESTQVPSTYISDPSYLTHPAHTGRPVYRTESPRASDITYINDPSRMSNPEPYTTYPVASMPRTDDYARATTKWNEKYQPQAPNTIVDILPDTVETSQGSLDDTDESIISGESRFFPERERFMSPDIMSEMFMVPMAEPPQAEVRGKAPAPIPAALRPGMPRPAGNPIVSERMYQGKNNQLRRRSQDMSSKYVPSVYSEASAYTRGP